MRLIDANFACKGCIRYGTSLPCEECVVKDAPTVDAVPEERIKHSFGSIAFYNGHEEWLWKLADDLSSCNKGFFECNIPVEEWNTDKHALWMFLVGIFGNWGTSIRSGWIEDTDAAADFINQSTDRYASWRKTEEEGADNG